LTYKKKRVTLATKETSPLPPSPLPFSHSSSIVPKENTYKKEKKRNLSTLLQILLPPNYLWFFKIKLLC
jgi:hypothetical protein